MRWICIALLALGCVEDNEPVDETCPADGEDINGFCVYRAGIQETGFECPPDRAQRYAEGPAGWMEGPGMGPEMCGPPGAEREALEEAWREANGPELDAGPAPDRGRPMIRPDASLQRCVEVSPTTVEFGNVLVGETALRPVALRNVCDADLVLLGPVTEGPLSFGPDGNGIVPPGGVIDFTVRFAPVQAGPFEGTARVEHDNGTLLRNIPVSGVGVASADPVTFRLVINNDIQQSIYAQTAVESGQPGWVTVQRGEDVVHLTPRCDIEDCDEPAGVCGAALPTVRDITGGGFGGEIELLWDGRWNVNDDANQCTRRQDAAAGDYVATFCYGFQAETEGPPNAQGDVAGQVLEPIQCFEVPFEHPGTPEVVHELAGG